MSEMDKMPYWNRWRWEHPVRRRVTWLLLVLPPVVGGVLYLFTDSRALFICFLSIFVLFVLIVDKPIGRKMERMRASWPPDAPEPVDCLIVNGFNQSPGLAAFVEDRIELWLLLGGKFTIELEQVEAVRETPIFNGSLLLGKTGFWLIIPGRARLGFAVPNSVAPEWRERLCVAPTSTSDRD